MQSKFFLCETYRRPKSQRQMDQNRGKRAHFEARGRDKFCCVDLIGGSWRSWIYKTPINPHTLNSASFRQECNTTKSSQILWEEKRFVILLLCSKVVILNLRILHIYLNLSNICSLSLYHKLYPQLLPMPRASKACQFRKQQSRLGLYVQPDSNLN